MVWTAVLIEAAGAIDALIKKTFLQSVPLIAVIQIGVFILSGLYRRSYRSGGISDLLDSLNSVVIALAMSWLAALIFRGNAHSAFNVAISRRLSARYHGDRRAVVVSRPRTCLPESERRGLARADYGTSNAVMSAHHEIRSNPGMDLLVMGFLDDKAGSRPCTLDGVSDLRSAGAWQFDPMQAVDEVVFAALPVSERGLGFGAPVGDVRGCRNHTPAFFDRMAGSRSAGAVSKQCSGGCLRLRWTGD
jgi:FlaA1/EpsC-like NDP-sugar epimerase